MNKSFFRAGILSSLLLALASCANVEPTVAIMGGSFSSISPLSISSFSPASNPTKLSGSKKVTVNAGAPGGFMKSFRALQVADTVDCKALDYSTAPEQALGEEFEFVVAASGKYKVCALGKTTLGTWASVDTAIASEVLVVDQTLPTYSMTSPQNAQFNSLLTVVVTFDEIMQIIPPTAWTATNSNIVSIIPFGIGYTLSLAAVGEGDVTLSLDGTLALDLAGNSTAPGTSLTRKFDSLAPTSPMIAINSGASVTTASNLSVTVSALDGPFEMYVTTDGSCSTGGAWVPYVTSFVRPVDFPNQQTPLSVKFRDQAKNVSSCVSTSIRHDNIPMSYTLTSSAGTYTNAPYTMTLTLNETPVSFSLSQLTKTNATLSNLTNVGNVYTFLVTPPAQGSSSVSVTVNTIYDLAGLSNTMPFTKTTIFDTVLPDPPSSGSLGTVPSTLDKSPPLNYNVGTDTGGSGILKYEARILKVLDNSVIYPWTEYASGTQLTGLTLSENGEYKFQIRSIDRALNASTSYFEKTWFAWQRPYNLVPWIESVTGAVQSIGQFSDSSFVVGGGFVSTGNISNMKGSTLRLTSAGFVDGSFTTGNGFDSTTYSSLTQASGKILVGGSFRSYDGAPAYYLARLNANGTLDASFIAHNKLNGGVTSIAEDGFGRLIIAGHFSMFNSVVANRILRLNADGSLDATFNSGLGFNNSVNKIAVQADGTIFAVGSFSSYDGQSAKQVARITSSGVIDTTFQANIGLGTTEPPYAVAAQTDGKVLVGGYFSQFNGVPNAHLVRLNADGTLDSTFNTVSDFDASVRDIAVLADGRISLVGDFGTVNGTARKGFTRLLNNGFLDSAITTTTVFDNTAYSIRLSGTQTYVGGVFKTYNGTAVSKLVRINDNGSLDNTFVVPELNSAVLGISVDASGRPLISGNFSSVGGTPHQSIAKFNASLNLNSAFSAGGVGFNYGVEKVLTLANDKILVGGFFSNYNGFYSPNFIRLNADGTTDTAFSTAMGTGPNGTVSAIVQQPDGKLIVAGNFTNFSGQTRGRIARLNTDGSVDLTFVTGSGFSESVYALALQPDGKILVAGRFQNYAGTPVTNVARLTLAGALDLSFTPNVAGDVYEITIDASGNVLIGGYFASVNGSSAQYIARLNAAGVLDTAFTANMGAGFNSGIRKIVIGEDGGYWIGGNFSIFNNVPRPVLLKLKSNGAIDTSVNTQSMITGLVVNDIKLLTDGKIAIGGVFNRYNASPVMNFMLLSPPVGTP